MRKTQSRHARSESSVDDHRGRASLSVRVLVTTLVNGAALHFPDSLRLGPRGAQADRSFYLVDEHGAMVNGERHGSPVRLRAECAPEEHWLSLRLADGAIVARDVSARDARVKTSYCGRPVGGRVVAGPWAEALSADVGMPVQMIASKRPGDDVDIQPETIESMASIETLSRSTADRTIDRRRFRMLIQRRGARSGCALDTRVDHLPDGGRMCFRVHGPVEVPGEVCIGDAVTVPSREDAA